MPDSGILPNLADEHPIVADPQTAAKEAGLRYVSDRQPGIRRERTPEGFVYRNPDGSPVADEKTLERIKKLAIPPAYEQVWICRIPNGHLQAVGRDARGRKQYRYHARWRAVRDENKYEKMLAFGRLLPNIRARVQEDIGRPGLPREKVLAAIVRLLETTLARVGNEEYARANRSFGLTTLRNRHVKVAGSHIIFDFKGKHGIKHHIDLADRKLARIVRRCMDIPGQDLFQYIGEDGEPHGIGSEDVNAYLRDISGEEITAKDFRTWAATKLAALALRELEAFDNQAKAKKNVVRAVEAVAKMLGNTPAICRKCYIHPAIFDGYLDGSLMQALKARADEALEQPQTGLSSEEVVVTAFLSQRLGEASREARAA
ncbi:MAG: DNA topoisomerase IB [Acetobacteraceae bacterium]|nr:DNA topoisomerase IB [Acetobacteraceae bacterium]MBV8520859.1 DNA topoisomerase IB [Acetobacteraceae bacterium]MBV8590711.1 DNA topoisomerase IB [Acetobacteraceae bacterium]